MMLGYFPIPHDDELLYSVIARFKIHHGLTSDRHIVNTLFGSRDVAAVVDLPGHLRALESNTFHLTNITAETWLMDHTLFPAYQHFLPTDRCKKLVDSMFNGRAWNVHTRIGHAASSVKSPDYLKVCHACYAHQIRTQGEPYWQRLFQLAGLHICPEHKEFLVDTNIPYRPASKFSFVSAIEAKTGPRALKNFTLRETDALIRYGECAAELLASADHCLNSLDLWSTYYSHLAQQSDCLLSASRVHHAKVHEAMEKFWGHKLLDHLQISIKGKNNWLINMFRKHRKSFHYLQHLSVWLAFERRPVSEILLLVSKLQTRKKKTFTYILSAAKSTVDEKRNQWLLFQRNHPGKGVKWLRKFALADAIYTWLYRHDRDWLFDNAPPKSEAVAVPQKVDWGERDALLLTKCKSLQKQNLFVNRDGRTSMAWLMKQVDRSSSFEKNQAKFPKTMAYLSSRAETVETYQQRRIVQVITALCKQQEQIKTWMVYRNAGIGKNYQTPSLEQFIQSVLRKCLLGSARLFSKNSR